MGSKYLKDINKTIDWDDSEMTEAQAEQLARSMVAQGVQTWGATPEPKAFSADEIVKNSLPQEANANVPKPDTEGVGDWLLRQGKGLMAGATMPGMGVPYSLLNTSQDMLKKVPEFLKGETVSPSENLALHKKNYDEFNQYLDKFKKDAPVASAIGSIAPAITTYQMAAGALKTPLKNTPKALKGLLDVLASGGANTISAQSMDFNPSRAPIDFALGTGGQLATSGLEKLRNVSRKIGGRLIESALKRPKSVIRREMKQGETLGETLYDRNTWRGVFGGTEGLEKQADKGLNLWGDKLKNALEPVKGQAFEKGTIIGELAELKKDYLKLPGRASAVQQIEDLMKEISQKPNFTVGAAQEMKQALQSHRTPNYLRELNPLQAEADMAIARGARKGIEKAAPETGRINKELSVHLRLKNALQDLEAVDKRGSIVNPLSLLGSGIAGTGVGFGTDDPYKGIGAAMSFLAAGTPRGKMGAAKILKSLVDNFTGATRYAAPVASGLSNSVNRN